MVRLQQLPGCEVTNQSTIRGQKVVLEQILKPHPAELLKDPVFQLAGELVYGKELQVDCTAMTIVVADVGDARANAGLDPELFVQFAGQGLLRAFSLLNFAARKFPLQPHWLVRAPLADQHFTAADDQRRRNKSQGGTGGPGIGVRLFVFHPSSVIALKGVQTLQVIPTDLVR